jgi:hypothetical protein
MSDSFQKHLLSGSTNGIGIPINATTSGSANTIHTAASTDLDECWISFVNNSGADAVVTLAIGGTGSTNLFSLTIPAGRGLVNCISGLTFTGSVVIKAYASVTGAIVAYGFVNRIVTI